MAKICEYENVYCPYCKSAKVKDEGCQAEIRKQNSHVVVCEKCGGTFAIPCEC